LKKACKKAGDIYHGSHAFRYQFAQERYDKIRQWTPQEQEEYYRRTGRVLEEKVKKSLKKRLKA